MAGRLTLECLRSKLRSFIRPMSQSLEFSTTEKAFPVSASSIHSATSSSLRVCSNCWHKTGLRKWIQSAHLTYICLPKGTWWSLVPSAMSVLVLLSCLLGCDKGVLVVFLVLCTEIWGPVSTSEFAHWNYFMCSQYFVCKRETSGWMYKVCHFKFIQVLIMCLTYWWEN